MSGVDLAPASLPQRPTEAARNHDSRVEFVRVDLAARYDALGAADAVCFPQLAIAKLIARLKMMTSF